MSLSNLKLGQTIYSPISVNGLVTEKQFIDPLTFKKIFVDDIVSVKAPSGAIVDFRVQSISDNDAIVLGPPHPKAKIAGHLNKTFVVASDFVNSKSNFRVKKADLVTVNNSSGKKLNMRVEYTIDNKFILLSLPEAKSMGLFYQLKMLWNLNKK